MKVAIVNVELDISGVRNKRYFNPIYDENCKYNRIKYKILNFSWNQLHKNFINYLACDINGFNVSFTTDISNIAYLIGNVDNTCYIIIPMHNLEFIMNNIYDIISPNILINIITDFNNMYVYDERIKKLAFIECL